MSGAPPKKKPFAFTSGPGGAPLPPPAAAAPVLPSAQRAGSQRARALLSNAQLLASRAPPPKEPKKPPPPRRAARAKRPPHPSLLSREALGATREAAAAAVARAAAAAPGGAAPRETEDEARAWRAAEAVAGPEPRRMPGFYGGDARREASDLARGRCAAEGPRLGDRLLETLRPHQVEGVSWVCARLWQNQGCVLADEMGLGKTATVLASLGVLMGVDGAAALETEKSFRAVIACPAGVAHTWLAEAKKWLRPTERCAARAQAGGSPHCCFFADADAAELRAFKRRKRVARAVDARERKKYGDAARDDWDADPDDAVARFARAPLSSKPVLVISYESYRAKASAVNAIKDVGLLVCDEAHRLKGGDDRVEAAAAIGDSPARKKLFVTATPVQNGVPELENLLRLAGALGPASGDAAADARALRSALSARTLRRGVEDAPALLGSLPRRRDALVFVDATSTQRALFAARATKAQGLRALTAAKHLCSSVKALDAALDDGGDTVGKWAFAERLLDAVRANDAREKVVLVSQFAATLDAGAALAARRGWGCARVDGATALDARRDAAAALNDADGGVFLLLLALKAGGVGLTLTGASRLILFEPSWNPADDDQAAARVWRDGQTRPTFIYTLATAHSLEEHVLKRQAAKRNLAGRVRHAQREVALLDLAEMEARFDADRDARDDLATLLALGTSSPDAPCALFAPRGPPEYRGDAPLAAAAAAAVQVDHLPDRFAPA